MEEELEKKPEKKEMLEPERDSRRTAKSIYRRGMLAGIGCTLLIFAAIAGTVLWVRHDITRRKGDYRPGAGVLSEDFMDEVSMPRLIRRFYMIMISRRCRTGCWRGC